MLDERGPSPQRDHRRGGETPKETKENDREEDLEEEKRRNPQDKSHLAYHDERFRCRKCARNASCFTVHKATQRMITIGKKKSLMKGRNKNNNNSDDARFTTAKGRLRGQRAKRRDFEEAGFGGASSSSSSRDYDDEEEEEEKEEGTTEKTTARTRIEEYAYDDPRYELKKLKDSGHRPTLKTYTYLICALGKQNKAKEAEEMFNQEAREEFDCDAAIFNAVRHG